MPKPDLYWYDFEIQRFVDGDTVWGVQDYGRRLYQVTELRLAGMDADARKTPLGQAALAHCLDWAAGFDNRVLLHSIKDTNEKWGRFLAELWPPTGPDGGPSLNQTLIDAGLAVPYNGVGAHK